MVMVNLGMSCARASLQCSLHTCPKYMSTGFHAGVAQVKQPALPAGPDSVDSCRMAVVQAELSPVLATIATSLANSTSLRECQAQHNYQDTGELKLFAWSSAYWLQACKLFASAKLLLQHANASPTLWAASCYMHSPATWDICQGCLNCSASRSSACLLFRT